RAREVVEPSRKLALLKSRPEKEIHQPRGTAAGRVQPQRPTHHNRSPGLAAARDRAQGYRLAPLPCAGVQLKHRGRESDSAKLPLKVPCASASANGARVLGGTAEPLPPRRDRPRHTQHTRWRAPSSWARPGPRPKADTKAAPSTTRAITRRSRSTPARCTHGATPPCVGT